MGETYVPHGGELRRVFVQYQEMTRPSTPSLCEGILVESGDVSECDRLLRALLHPGEERAVFDSLPHRVRVEALANNVVPREIARLRRTYVVNYPIRTSAFHVEKYKVRIVNAQPYRNGGPVFVRYDLTLDGRVYSGFRSFHDELLTHEAREHAVRILAGGPRDATFA